MHIQSRVLLLLLATGPLFAADLLYDSQEAQTLLGYDPGIILIKEGDPKVVSSQRKTVYFHGFGGNKEAASLVKRFYGAERLPGDVITFDFADSNYGAMDQTQSSLGQWNDIKTALYVLKKLHDAGEKEIGITAHSRGGATAINMVAALVDTTGQYDARLSELGIDQAKREGIVQMLRNGHMVLECPLISVRDVIHHHIQEACESSSSTSWFGWIRSWIPSASVDLSTASVAASVDYGAPLVLKKYRPWAEQAIQSVDAWNGANIPTIVHFQENDEVLGNANKDEFFEKLRAANGERTYRHLGSDGGHNSSFKSFALYRNYFLRKFDAAYRVPEK